MSEPDLDLDGAFDRAAAAVAPLDQDAMAAARRRQASLTKPPGALGRLEAIGEQLCGIARTCPPPLPRPAVTAIFAGDHGVHARGVTPWPQEVTAQMVANLCAGGAAANVIAGRVGADVVVVDVGVAGSVAEHPRLRRARVVDGTADLASGPALTGDEADRALDTGAALAAALIGDGARCLLTGEMGIANTTAAAALIAALTGRPTDEVTGRGTGIDDPTLTRKRSVVGAAVARVAGAPPRTVLAEVGGAEHAALAGFIVGAAAARVPVLVDGVITQSALLVASALVPGVEELTIVAHRSSEPGSAVVLAQLGLEPVLDLELRLGEGTGALLALPVVDAAAAVLRDMATFGDAGVTDR